jgi:hypothetical protein
MSEMFAQFSGIEVVFGCLTPDPPSASGWVSVAQNENALLSREDVDCDVNNQLLKRDTS